MQTTIVTLKLKDIIKEEFSKVSFDLMTRQTGQKIFQRLEKEINSATEDQTIILDFTGVGAIDYSCADEVIAKLISRLQLNEYGNKYLALCNLTPTQKENIHVALERRNLAMLEHKNEERFWEVIGVVDDYLLKTLELIMEKEKISSSQLSELLNLELNTASMRLINLNRLKLVKKILASSPERGKRHFIYQSVFA